MPVGDIVEIELSYGGGNKDRAFVVVQFDNIRPDLGRKTFERQVNQLAQTVAEHLVTNLVTNKQYLIPADTPHGDTESEQQMTLQAIIDAANKRDPLPLAGLGLSKKPQRESEVIGLFHALLGKGLLKGFDIMSVLDSTTKYDAVFKYSLKQAEMGTGDKRLNLPTESFGKKGAIQFPPCVLELKVHLSDLVNDFEEGTKFISEIKVAVAWDDGEQKAYQGTSDYRLEPIDHNSKDMQFFGETHLLRSTSGNHKIHIILLHDVLEILADIQ